MFTSTRQCFAKFVLTFSLVLATGVILFAQKDGFKFTPALPRPNLDWVYVEFTHTIPYGNVGVTARETGGGTYAGKFVQVTDVDQREWTWAFMVPPMNEGLYEVIF